MAKLTDTAPPACASCGGQYPDRRHVDFEAAFDGPVLDHQQGIQIDDLIVCEECLTEGARLLGLVDWSERNDELDALRAQVAEQEERLLERQRYAEQLEQTIASRPASAAGTVKRRPGRQTAASGATA